MFSNFTYFNPVKLIFGKETISKLSKNISANAKILMTYGGGSIFKNGVYDQVKAALAGYDIIEFGGIEANPTFETLMKAVELGRENKIDFLLAVGGGSVLDGTKFIAAAIPFTGGDEWNNIVCGKAKYDTAIPIGTVLTLPATGSEMNIWAVISKASTQEKLGMGSVILYPKFSILDPEVTYSLPKKQVANGIADAFVHVMEQYLTYPVNAEIQDRIAEGVLQTLIKISKQTIENPTDYEARANMMWAATVALSGWINCGIPEDWATHQIGHEITALHGVDHARTLAVVMPYLFKVKFENKKAKLAQYARRVWELEGTNEDELAENAIQKTIEFFESLEIPTKASAYGVDAKTIATIKQRFTDRKVVWGEHQDITPDVVEEILNLSIA